MPTPLRNAKHGQISRHIKAQLVARTVLAVTHNTHRVMTQQIVPLMIDSRDSMTNAWNRRQRRHANKFSVSWAASSRLKTDTWTLAFDYFYVCDTERQSTVDNKPDSFCIVVLQ